MQRLHIIDQHAKICNKSKYCQKCPQNAGQKWELVHSETVHIIH